ncbi:hypothetical protein DNK06_08830 [Pseudomonas daroniae]|uniref:Uncharacterized protein n=1 Tax=Phytopseudomonas daroniae TaxID=2487519 RepID=A0A4Q9QP54_9GAMM|nr:hypothetical protein DNK06_08830 [Pseudomonas daroniae]TBU83728.1 hypothetical protein DNK31_09595 [Pseudomonas sp. FRB 228]TBU89338.1 hypothetical protein DNJ99_16525 [Pseudomonas daroniae]
MVCPSLQNQRPGVQARASKRRTSATVEQQALFLCPLFAVMVAACGRASALPGSFCPGLAHPHAAATHHVQVMLAVPQQKELYQCTPSIRPKSAHWLTAAWH